jgi:hypothetical protein
MKLDLIYGSSLTIYLKSGLQYRCNPGINEIHPDFEDEILEHPTLQFYESVGQIKFSDGKVDDALEHNIGMSVDKKEGLPVSTPEPVSSGVKSKIVPSKSSSATQKKREASSAPVVSAQGENKAEELDFRPGKN